MHAIEFIKNLEKLHFLQSCENDEIMTLILPIISEPFIYCFLLQLFPSKPFDKQNLPHININSALPAELFDSQIFYSTFKVAIHC